MSGPLRFVFIGLSITSSWGNGHATTYRGLIQALAARGHSVLFLEQDARWYAGNRDLPQPPYCRTELYGSVEQLRAGYEREVRAADVVIVGSYVKDGVAVGDWVLQTAEGIAAFYDIDTPITLRKLEDGDFEYLSPSQMPRYDLYLSFTGGPVLDELSRRYAVRLARPLYCSVDPIAYRATSGAPPKRFAMGYLGTYSSDRQPILEALLLEPARRLPDQAFSVAGAQYPEGIEWPRNVERTQHIAPPEHPAYYCSQRLTLNVTRAEMRLAGHSPSVRLFEAAACGVPIITDRWLGLTEFFEPGREILVADSADEVLELLRRPDAAIQPIAEQARRRVLGAHTGAHRAAALERYVVEARGLGHEGRRA